MLFTNIDLSKVKEPEHHTFCDLCGAISIGKEKPALQERLVYYSGEEETELRLVSWSCTEYGHLMGSWELSEYDRQFLRSVNIKCVPWDPIKPDRD